MTEHQNASNTRELLRELPSVDKLLQSPEANELVEQHGHPLTLEALRHALAQQRSLIMSGRASTPKPDVLLQRAREWLKALLMPTLRPVINGTGIIVHTNLGRAPLSSSSLATIQAVSRGYSSLEYDLSAGQRGSRAVHAEELLIRLTGAEAALVVNNNAAAVLLMLTALCQGKEVIISRSQLVEIGGGFRVPDVMAQSGATLVEVGTTNRTHLRDYQKAISEETAAILVAHHSNYKIIGFTAEPTLAEVATLAHKHQVPLLYDQGSGALLDTARFGLEPEPTVLEGIQAGSDVLAFSGDKLLGGPQAGILVGKSDLINQLKKHPLARAVRADKTCLAGLAATLLHYLKDEPLAQIPVWRMIARTVDEIEADAREWVSLLQSKGIQARVVDGRSMVGGGSLPGTFLLTKLVGIQQVNPDDLASALRARETPVIGRIQDDMFQIDPRTILPGQTDALLGALIEHCKQEDSSSPGTQVEDHESRRQSQH